MSQNQYQRIIRHGTVITPHALCPDHSVAIKSGHIHAIVPDSELAYDQCPQVIDATECTIIPGLVDVHIHGIGSHDTMDATPKSLNGMAQRLAQRGVTSFLPTTVAAPHSHLLQVTRNVSHIMDQKPTGARVLGIHLEGPYLNPQKRGAHAAQSLRSPDVAELDAYLDTGAIKMVTIAPELEGSETFIRHTVEKGVTVSLGHTLADYDLVQDAVEWGITHASHTFNAMGPLHHRHPGACGAVLNNKQIYAEMIADLVHLHPAILNLIIKAKGISRTILVSDAIRAADLPEGTYTLGEQPVTVQNGVCRLADGTLAGSSLTLDQALHNVIQVTGLSLVKALPMATSVPAASLKLDDKIGSLLPGHRADMVILDSQHQVVLTLVDGQVVFRNPKWQGSRSRDV